MKFGTLLELNSNIEWWNYYVDYDALKKLFPSSPLDPSYRSTEQESSSLLPITSSRAADKYASPEEFRAALDREREKVESFYRGKYADLADTYRVLLDEITAIEDRELGGDDVIKEENEEDISDDDGDGANGESDVLLRRSSSNFPGHTSGGGGAASNRPLMQKRASIMHRLGAGWKARRRGSALPTSTHEADLMEASVASLNAAQPRRLSLEGSRRMSQSADEAMLSPTAELPPSAGTAGTSASPTARRKSAGRHQRRSSDLGSASNDSQADRDRDRDRRASMSSTSSHEREFALPRRRWQSLELVQMDDTEVPDAVKEDNGTGVRGRMANGNGDAEMGDIQEEEQYGGMEQDRPVYVWTGSNDHATVMRIGFKKRVSANWLEAYALKQYVDLNLTAFEKILKKYDKNTNSKLKKDYVSNTVLPSPPWSDDSRTALDALLDRIIFLYRRVVTSGDEDLAKEQLRSQLREKVVVDRETVWSQMVSGHRDGIFRSVTPEFQVGNKGGRRWRTPFGRIGVPEWVSAKGLIFCAAVGVLVGIVLGQPMKRVEESNCLAMLVFCTILWATEAIPLFVTSLSVPLLVVLLRVIRSASEPPTRLSASDATKFIFSQMFNPTIMLLIGGFTIAAVLSKTRLDVMTASRILNAAGTNPSVVLLVLMAVATFASMWISNVAAPTLCYALIKPITNELHPKSVFSKALIIAIALAANIGGQASPISSPQNLIALGDMSPPLSWLQWFAISIPVSSLSVLAIWAFLHVNYRWESDLRIPRMRKNTDTLTRTHYFVLLISGITIALWCVEKNFEGVVGDMGVIAILPLVAFFGTGILSKEDFHSFHWSIVFLAMGGIALGKATLSSGLLDELDQVLERLVEGMGLYQILLIFSALALVIATFISHTIAAVLLVPIATRIGESLEDPHPRLLIMATALICSAGMGLPVSGFPNMTAITQENKLGQRFIGASDFLKNGIPASILATGVIVSVGYAIMRALGL